MSSPYSVIYSFGDNQSDAGDEYLLTSTYGSFFGTSAQPVSPPYFQETYGTTTANVFSNGPVWVQDLDPTYGLPASGPGQVGATGTQLLAAGAPAGIVALLDGGNASNYVTLVPGATGGTDFAIGQSVTGPTNFNTSGSSALTDLQSQISSFQHEYPTPATNALYTIQSGSNDILNLLQSSTFQAQSTAASQQEIAQSAQNEVNAVISLSDLGAKTILVGNVPNLGLIPEITAQGSGMSAVATAYSQYFNYELQSDLQAASSQLAGSTVTVLDNFGLSTSTTDGTVVPGPNGGTITDTTDPAYTGSYTADNGTEVLNPDNYLYFDQVNLTQTGQQAVANLAAGDLGSAVCFAAGTRIGIALGETIVDVAVENLAVGDLAVTLSGAHRPIRWLGHRLIDCRRHPCPHEVMPIRIAIHAFGPGRPSRDLLLSPGHPVLVGADANNEGGHLVPVMCLVNGTTIERMSVDEVTYWHVELDAHDILLAENLPAESYIDLGSRPWFAGAAGALYDPDMSHPGMPGRCRPVAVDGPIVEAERRRLDVVLATRLGAACAWPSGDGSTFDWEINGCRPRVPGSALERVPADARCAAWALSWTQRASS